MADNAYAGATGQDRRTLDAIFQHPLSHNLDWHDVVGLMTSIGGIEENSNGVFSLGVGADRLSMNKPHGKDIASEDLVRLRALLSRAGWAPNAAASAHTNLPVVEHDAVIVIDHAGARVFQLGIGGDTALTPSSREPKVVHLTRELKRNDHGQDRDESYPKDTQLFERIAMTIANDQRIVLIGHGHGQSNEAHHLSAYLGVHHKDIHARIIETILADLPHITTPELLELGRGALN